MPVIGVAQAFERAPAIGIITRDSPLVLQQVFHVHLHLSSSARCAAHGPSRSVRPWAWRFAGSRDTVPPPRPNRPGVRKADEHECAARPARCDCAKIESKHSYQADKSFEVNRHGNLALRRPDEILVGNRAGQIKIPGWPAALRQGRRIRQARLNDDDNLKLRLWLPERNAQI